MKYNTARNQLILPEYGRHVQKMVEYATTLESKEDRNKCVNAIINFMGQMNPQLKRHKGVYSQIMGSSIYHVKFSN